MLSYQIANPKDTAAIALLHAQSWQQNYKGILSEDYLNNKVKKERLEIWKKRFSNPPDNQHIITAKDGEKLCGFICLYCGDDPIYGTLLDNLHISKYWKRKGIGRNLMKLAVQWINQQSEEEGMYLWFFEENINAAQFYKKMGGKKIEVISYKLMDESGYTNAVRYYWENPITLIKNSD